MELDKQRLTIRMTLDLLIRVKSLHNKVSVIHGLIMNEEIKFLVNGVRTALGILIWMPGTVVA